MCMMPGKNKQVISNEQLVSHRATCITYCMNTYLLFIKFIHSLSMATLSTDH